MTTSDFAVARSQSLCCPVCDSQAGNLHLAREMMLGTGEAFPYWECTECGCVSLARAPREMGKYYPAGSYYSFQNGATTTARKLRNQLYLSPASFLVNWRRRTDLDVIRRVGLTKSMTLLDVGCGSGHLLADLRELGYNATGIDPFVTHDIHDRYGVRVERRSLCDVKAAYEVILFRHSLEHMQLDALRLARSHLRNHGLCVVCIPVIGWAWRHYQTSWAQLDPPRHLFLHSRKSFELLAAASGFRIESVIFDSSEFQFWASDCYQQNIPLVRANAPGFVDSLKMRRQAAALNRRGLGDSAQFYLRPVS